MVLQLLFQTFRMAMGSMLLWVAVCLWGYDRLEPFEPAESSWPSPAARQPERLQPGQWPGYRGETLQGGAVDATLPKVFGPDVNGWWSLDLPGAGNSSPTLIGDRVFLTAQCPASPPELTVICIDRRDGEVRWKRAVGVPAGQTHCKNGYAAATVATDGSDELLAVNRLQERCLATPAIGRDELFIRTDQRLYCFAEPLDAASDNATAARDSAAKITPASTSQERGE